MSLHEIKAAQVKVNLAGVSSENRIITVQVNKVKNCQQDLWMLSKFTWIFDFSLHWISQSQLEPGNSIAVPGEYCWLFWVLLLLSLRTRVNIQLQAVYACIWPFIYTFALLIQLQHPLTSSDHHTLLSILSLLSNIQITSLTTGRKQLQSLHTLTRCLNKISWDLN